MNRLPITLSPIAACCLALVTLLTVLSYAGASEERPYLGEWSNGRGETLIVTEKTIQFAEEHPVAYRDVTRATDGSDFELQITGAAKLSGLAGNTLALHCHGDTMEMTGYASHAAYMQGGEVQMQVTWDRDSDEHSD